MAFQMLGTNVVKMRWPNRLGQYPQGGYGSIDQYGLPVLRTSDFMELALLEKLTKQHGRYVFRNRSGAFGYLDNAENFVVVA